MKPEHISAKTFHKRLGLIDNRFTYVVDYLLFEPERLSEYPRLFSRNKHNVMTFWDKHHGGPRGAGRGTPWVRKVFERLDTPLPKECRIFLLAQPKLLWFWFSPVSFWLITDAKGTLIAAIAEVNNTFGDRHSYLCMHPDFTPIMPNVPLKAQKLMHVSPFQPTVGTYTFNFELTADQVFVRINYTHENGGVLATLGGRRKTLRNRAILGVVLRRPFGMLRVVFLIHYQAVKLFWKRARFWPRPAPPRHEVSGD